MLIIIKCLFERMAKLAVGLVLKYNNNKIIVTSRHKLNSKGYILMYR